MGAFLDFLWAGTELNRRHEDFQSSALPTELPTLDIVRAKIKEGLTGVKWIKDGGLKF